MRKSLSLLLLAGLAAFASFGCSATRAIDGSASMAACAVAHGVAGAIETTARILCDVPTSVPLAQAAGIEPRREAASVAPATVQTVRVVLHVEGPAAPTTAAPCAGSTCDVNGFDFGADPPTAK